MTIDDEVKLLRSVCEFLAEQIAILYETSEIAKGARDAAANHARHQVHRLTAMDNDDP